MNKKIAGIVLATSIAAAGAFAEAKTNLCFTGTLNAADWTFNSDGSTTSKYFQQGEDYKDSLLSASIATDYAGVKGAVRFDSLANVNSTTYQALYFDYLYGWLQFGGFKVTAGGSFDTRFTDRVKKDITDISFVETQKYGTFSGVAKDADNLSNSLLSTVVGYTFTFDTSKLMLNGVLTTPTSASIGSSTVGNNQKQSNTVIFGNSTTGVFSGYAFEAVYQSPVFSLDAILKVPMANQLSAGAYATVVPVKACTVVVGGVFGSDTSTTNTTVSSVGIDARVRYAFTDALSCTFMGNYSNQKTTVSGSDTNVDGKYANLNATYKVNDNISAFIEAGYIDAGTTATDKSDETVNGLFGAVISPGAGAKLSAGIRAKKVLSDKGVFGLSIPVALDIAL
jgi:predicted porin